MFCHKCGKAIPEGAAFCPGCGERVVGSSRAATETAATSAGARATGSGTAGKRLLFKAKRSVCACAKRLASSIVLFIAGIIIAIVMLNMEVALFAVFGIIAALVGVGIFVYTFIEASHYEILFYEGRVVVKSGVFNTREDQSIMTPVIGVRIVQSFWGKIFNYGTVIIDKTGRGWDIKTTYLKNPQKVKEFIEGLIDSTDLSRLNMFITN